MKDVDVSGRVTLSDPLDDPRSLAGRFVAVRGATGLTSHWRVAEAPDARTLQLDTDHSALITLQGAVERIENPRLFISGIRPVEQPRYNLPIRIGQVGDFSSPRWHLRHAQQTGLPLRIGGTTTTLQPRECQFGLEWAAKLTDEHVGQTFWVSGIEIGDDVFTDLVTTVELKG